MALSTISGTTGITDATITSAKLADFTAAVDLNGVELLLDADADTSISADTDDRIDFKIANTDHFSLSSSSGDTVFKPLTDAKDLIFQQFDGNKVLEINDSGFVGIGGNSNAAGEIRIFEDTDDGNNYVGLKVGNVTTAYTLVFPNADGSNGQAMVTNGSGVLSFTDVSSAADDIAAGDAAINLTTTSGNITIDAQGNDTDIIFKGTDGSADTTFLTIDGSAAGAATFNAGITATTGTFSGVVDADAGVTIDNITIDGTEIDLSSGDLTVDVAGDIILDADGGDFNFKDGGTEILRITNSSSDVIIRPVVDAKDLIFQQRDGTEVARVEDNGTFNIVTAKLAINGTAVTSTAAELNLLDGDTSVGSSITLADADGFVVNDGGTMKTIPASDIKTYNPGGTAWQSVVTSNTTMVAGRGYFVDTTSSAITMTLPSSASQGDTIQIIDYAGTADTNNITIGRNSHKIQGDAADLTVSTERAAFSLVYVDATQGWLLDSK